MMQWIDIQTSCDAAAAYIHHKKCVYTIVPLYRSQYVCLYCRKVSITRITLRMRDNGCSSSSSSSSFNTQRESSMSASPRGPGSSTNVPDTADSQSPIGDQVSATPRDRSFALAGSVFSAEYIAGRIPVVLVSVPSTPVKDRAHF